MQYYIILDENKYVMSFSKNANSFANYSISHNFETKEEEDKFEDYFSYYRYSEESNTFLLDNTKINKNNIEFSKQTNLYSLKEKLNQTDYKIIKCYEAFMRQQPLPYNLEELSAQRDAWRAEINALEEELLTL
jgi:hypothetical protein